MIRPLHPAVHARIILLPLLFPLGLTAGCGSGGSTSGEVQQGQAAFVLDEGTVTLSPGQEGLLCNQMAVPAEYASADTFVTGIDADVSLGTHHLVVIGNDDAVGSTAALCKDTGQQATTGGALFQDLAFNADLATPVIASVKQASFAGGGGTARIRFPTGYGKAMPLGFFESSHHVQNVGTQPLEIFGRFGVHTAKRADIAFPMGVFFANAFTIQVDPLSDGSVEGTMTAPEPIEVVLLTSHSHDFTTRVEMFAYRSGAPESTPVYVSTSYESPAVAVLDPPLHLEAGDGITFRCHYHNGRTTPLTWGVNGGEMCMPQGMYAYPEGASRETPPTMSVPLMDSTPAPLAIGGSGFFG